MVDLQTHRIAVSASLAAALAVCHPRAGQRAACGPDGAGSGRTSRPGPPAARSAHRKPHHGLRCRPNFGGEAGLGLQARPRYSPPDNDRDHLKETDR